MALGIDTYRDRELARLHRRQDAQGAWEERVQEEAADLLREDPGMEADEAWDMAAERLRRKDKEEAERYWDSVAYERGMG